MDAHSEPIFIGGVMWAFVEFWLTVIVIGFCLYCFTSDYN